LAFSRRFIDVAGDNKVPVVAQLPLELAVIEICFGSARPLIASVSPVSPSPTSGPRSPRINPVSAPVSASAPKRSPAPIQPVARPKTDSVSHSDLCLSGDEVCAKWPEFLVKIKKCNHSLSFVLQNCQPQAITDGQLNLVFKYKFHQDRINDPNIRGIVEQTLQEVFASPLSVNSIVNENLDLRRANDPAPAESAAAADDCLEDSGLVLGSGPISAKPDSKSSASDNPPAGGLIADLLKSFGGEIIN